MTAAIAGSAILGPISAAEAGPAGARFTCLSRGGTPATVALTKRGPVPVINWQSTLGGGVYTPKVRCDIVSKRFQDFYENGTLNYLTTGIKNRLPIVCVALYKGGACKDQLFTLKPGSNPGLTLRRLMAVRVGAGGPLNESASRPYFSMEELLESAPVDNSIQVPEELAVQPAPTTPAVTPVTTPVTTTPAVTPVTPVVPESQPEVDPVSTPVTPQGTDTGNPASGSGLW